MNLIHPVMCLLMKKGYPVKESCDTNPFETIRMDENMNAIYTAFIKFGPFNQTEKTNQDYFKFDDATIQLSSASKIFNNGISQYEVKTEDIGKLSLNTLHPNSGVMQFLGLLKYYNNGLTESGRLSVPGLQYQWYVESEIQQPGDNKEYFTIFIKCDNASSNSKLYFNAYVYFEDLMKIYKSLYDAFVLLANNI